MKTKYLWALITLTFIVLASNSVLAWGGRGHHTVCDAAAYLVKEPGLKELMQIKPHVMGHLCNIPDIYWKDIGAEINKVGRPTHYVNPEILGLRPSTLPLDYKKLITDFTGSKNKFKDGTIFSIPLELGSNWWRADQFYRRAIALENDFKNSVAPANSKEEQDSNLLYNKTVYDFFVNLGLMGHFVGDNGQPYHSTADHDGFHSNHGGIHAYFEENMVSNQAFNLGAKVVEEGMKLQKSKPEFLKLETVLEKMRSLSDLSYIDIKKIEKLDPVLKPSTEKEEKGMLLREKAERKPAGPEAKKFTSLVITEMARSAVLLAQIWDMAYVKVGSPDLTKYKSFRHPFTPEFVVPDYYEEKDLGKK